MPTLRGLVLIAAVFVQSICFAAPQSDCGKYLSFGGFEEALAAIARHKTLAEFESGDTTAVMRYDLQVETLSAVVAPSGTVYFQTEVRFAYQPGGTIENGPQFIVRVESDGLVAAERRIYYGANEMHAPHEVSLAAKAISHARQDLPRGRQINLEKTFALDQDNGAVIVRVAEKTARKNDRFVTLELRDGEVIGMTKPIKLAKTPTQDKAAKTKAPAETPPQPKPSFLALADIAMDAAKAEAKQEQPVRVYSIRAQVAQATPIEDGTIFQVDVELVSAGFSGLKERYSFLVDVSEDGIVRSIEPNRKVAAAAPTLDQVKEQAIAKFTTEGRQIVDLRIETAKDEAYNITLAHKTAAGIKVIMYRATFENGQLTFTPVGATG